MKKLVLILAMVLVPVVTFSADVPIAWNAVHGATGYNLYQSFDVGVTWTAPADMGNQISATVVVVETGLVLFKIGAYNANGETITEWQGAWYDHRKLPLPAPVGLGVQ
jgi:hypothetical protein